MLTDPGPARRPRQVWPPVVAIGVLVPLFVLVIGGSALLLLSMPVLNGRVTSIQDPCALADAGLLRSLGVNLTTAPTDDQTGVVALCEWRESGSSASLELTLSCSHRNMLTSADSEAHQYFQYLQPSTPSDRALFGPPKRVHGLGDEAVLYGGDFLVVRTANVVWYLTMKAPRNVLMADAHHVNQELQAGRSS